MKLIIAEKPDMMRKIKDAIDGRNAKSVDGYYESDEIIYTSGFGHLCELMKPKDIDMKWAKWSLNTLPLDMPEIPLEVKKDAVKQFNLIKKLCADKRVSEIINACDADREGESIFRSLFEYDARKPASPERQNERIPTPIKVKSGVKYSRMWIKSTTPEGIKEAYEDRKPSALYDLKWSAAKERRIADYRDGLGGTMAMTAKFGNGKEVYVIGRVNTPTSNMVYLREMEIRNFKSEPFFTVKAALKENEIVADHNHGRFNKKEEADAVAKKTGLGEAKVITSESKTKKESCKLLHSLSTLQVEMNKKYGYSAQLVLDTCQALYQNHSLITYPRTDETRISPSMANRAISIVENLPVYTDITAIILSKGYKINKNCISKDTEAIGAHEALTPVLGSISKSKIDKLSTVELNVFNEVVERFLQAFFPDAVYQVQNIEIERNGEVYSTTNIALLEKGYLEVGNRGYKSDEILSLKKGDIVHIVENIVLEGKTEPPARFTEATLLQSMKNPIKYVTSKEDKDILKEVEGIGTEATRAGIIENMKKQGMIEIKKKTIYPTEKCMTQIELIPDEDIKSVKLTADFEKKLKLIEDGKYDPQKFDQENIEYQRKFIEVLKNMENKNTNTNTNTQEEFCKCPNCGKPVIKNNWGYFCSDKDCGVKLFSSAFEKAFGYKKITDTQAKELLTSGKTKKTVKLTSKKTGKEYEAFLTYKFDKGAQFPNATGIEFPPKK